MKRFARIASAGAVMVGGAAAIALAGAGSASAASVTPIPGGVQIDINHNDAQFLSGINFAGLNGLPGGWDSGLAAGDGLNYAIGQAASSEDGWAALQLYGPITDPAVVLWNYPA